MANQISTINSYNFPPYNIWVDSPKYPSEYVLELAVAGFTRDEISVKVRKEDGIDYLLIEGTKSESTSPDNYIVKMMAARSFRRTFILSENAKVADVTLNNGILRVVVKVEHPEPIQVETVIQIK